MAQIRVSLGFARLPDKELDNFALSVKDSLTANQPPFPGQPKDAAGVKGLFTR